MASGVPGRQLRYLNFGTRVDAVAYTLQVETHPLFTVTGGLVAVTALWGYVSTAITVANTAKLTHDPTVGTTVDLCTATDIGTTDTPVGDYLSITGVLGDAMNRTIGAAVSGKYYPLIYLNTGSLTQITATGADGVVSWSLTYIPIDNGAAVVGV